MNWLRFAAVVTGAGLLTSLTDWFFAGDWIHRRFTYPEIWRTDGKGKAIALTSVLPFLSCAVFVLTAVQLSGHSSAHNFACGSHLADWPIATHSYKCGIY